MAAPGSGCGGRRGNEVLARRAELVEAGGVNDVVPLGEAFVELVEAVAGGLDAVVAGVVVRQETIGAFAALTGSFPLAISLLSVIYIVGLPFIAMAPETANQPLAK